MRLVLTPEEMQSSSVERTFFIGPSIGYLHVTSFDENTGKDIKAGIEKLGGDKLNGLILDLRGNPGGVVTAALETASLFLQPGQDRVYRYPRDAKRTRKGRKGTRFG